MERETSSGFIPVYLSVSLSQTLPPFSLKVIYHPCVRLSEGKSLKSHTYCNQGNICAKACWRAHCLALLLLIYWFWYFCKDEWWIYALITSMYTCASKQRRSNRSLARMKRRQNGGGRHFFRNANGGMRMVNFLNWIDFGMVFLFLGVNMNGMPKNGLFSFSSFDFINGNFL